MQADLGSRVTGPLTPHTHTPRCLKKRTSLILEQVEGWSIQTERETQVRVWDAKIGRRREGPSERCGGPAPQKSFTAICMDSILLECMEFFPRYILRYFGVCTDC